MRATWVCVVAVAMCTAGCASNSTSAAADAARAFYSAVSNEDGARACELLTPRTRQELEQAAGATCRVAVMEEAIPEVDEVLTVERFGNQAQVRFRGETAFLSEFAGGWRVVAVGCTPRTPLPYDCQVKA